MNINFRASFRRAAASVRNFSNSSSGDFQPSSMWATYNRYLTEKPVLTKSITSGVIAFLGDVGCQKYFPHDKKNNTVDWGRTFRFTLLGTALVGPLLHYWYGFLATKIPGTTAVSTLYRVALDQLLFAPFCILPAFFSCSLILNGTPELIPQKLKEDWLPTVIANFALWVPAQFINFKFLAPQFQVLFANVVGLFWNVYLSAVTNKTVETHSSASVEELEAAEPVSSAPSTPSAPVVKESVHKVVSDAPKRIHNMPAPEGAHLSETTPDGKGQKLPSKKLLPSEEKEAAATAGDHKKGNASSASTGTSAAPGCAHHDHDHGDANKPAKQQEEKEAIEQQAKDSPTTPTVHKAVSDAPKRIHNMPAPEGAHLSETTPDGKGQKLPSKKL